ncbi:flavoprotein [Bacillus cereus]|uniref:flavoprotein n=1 Tax=Bacillus cereus group sp. MYBK185-1 TaxID=3450672 RepID=UPI0037B28CDA
MMRSKPLKILIGACGSSNVLNLHNYLIHFRNISDSINVIMTKSASNMIQSRSIEIIVGNTVYTDNFSSNLPVSHINLARWADLFIVIPATANIIGKVANGIADDLLSTTLLAAKSPVFFVPSMNRDMWSKPSVQRNIRTLDKDGFYFIFPREAQKAFEVSSGNLIITELMPSPEEIVETIGKIVRFSPMN